MDGLEFTSKVIEAGAWPVTVVVLVYKFSDRFRELLGKITEVTLPGGISSKFEQKLEGAEQLARQSGLVTEEDEVESTGDPVETDANPVGVIMEMWAKLTSVAADLIQSSDIPSRDKMLMYSKQNRQVSLFFLEKEGLVPVDEIKLLTELKSIRDRAARSTSSPPTPADANRFVSIASALESRWIGRIAADQPRDA